MRTLPTLAAIALALGIVQAKAADVPAPPAPPPAPAPALVVNQSTGDQIESQLRRAQEQLDRSAREVAELSMKLSAQPWVDLDPVITVHLPRVVLGINVGGSGRGSEKNADGVAIVSVSPGGPADIAGLKSNDVIVALNGKELHAEQSRRPRQQLLALIHDLKPGSPVMVQYRRDGNVQTTRIVPKNMSEFVMDSVDHEMRDLNRGMSEFNFGMKHDLTGFGSVELLNLSAALGKYFGTDKGLLVVRAPRDERLQLQDGDVILDIDGRVPNGASHASQILNSYRSGEKFKMHIMRQQKRVELQIDMPENVA